MSSSESRYHLIFTIIIISLIIAAGVSILYPSSQPQREDALPSLAGPSQELPDGSPEDETFIVRILWFDDLNQTYSFQDYPQEGRPDIRAYSIPDTPPVPGLKAAMVRSLSWDGTTERTLDTEYLTDQEKVTAILNGYTLRASKSLVSPAPVETRTPTPRENPAPGSVLPRQGAVCRNSDGSYTAGFGYLNRNEYPVLIPVGPENRFSPGVADRGQPEVFKPGIHDNAFSVTYPSDATNQVWTLMGRQVSAGTVPAVTTMLKVEPITGYAPLEVRVSEQSTGGTPDNPLVKEWNLGDGTKKPANQGFMHRYENPGTYLVTHVVENHCALASDREEVQVFRASFSWNPVPDAPSTIQFTDTSGGSPEVWFWVFSDGYTSWEKNPVHTFPAPGDYQVGLTVSGPNGRGTAVGTVTI